MSAVVLQELVAGASDRAILKALDASRKQYEREDKLLVPSGEDYFQAGKILNSFLRRAKARPGSKTPRLQPNRIQKMFRDTLIAVSVHRKHAFLVTNNVRDFEPIQRYCNVRVVQGKSYFGR